MDEVGRCKRLDTYLTLRETHSLATSPLVTCIDPAAFSSQAMGMGPRKNWPRMGGVRGEAGGGGGACSEWHDGFPEIFGAEEVIKRGTHGYTYTKKGYLKRGKTEGRTYTIGDVWVMTALDHVPSGDMLHVLE